MAINFVQLAENSADPTSGSIIATFGTPVVAGNHIIVGTSWANGSVDVSSIGDGGDTFNPVATKVTAGAHPNYCQIWYAENSIGGITAIQVNYSGGGGAFRTIGVHEVSGLRTSGSLDQVSPGGTAETGTTLDPGNVTITFADEYLFAFGQSFAAQNFTPGSSWNARTTPGTGAFTQDRIVAAIATYATLMTGDVSDVWYAQAATFKGPVSSTPIALGESGWYPSEQQTNPLIISKW